MNLLRHFWHSIWRARKYWPLSLIGSLALAYLEGALLLTIPNGYYLPHKMLAALAAVPFIFMGLSYLIGRLFLPRWAAISKKNRLELLALSAVVAAALFFIVPNPKPLIPQTHQLELVANGDKYILSHGSEVEVRQIRALDGKNIPLDQLRTSGDWQFSSGSLLSLRGSSDSVADVTGSISGGVIISLRYSENAGIVNVRWDGEERGIDLYVYANGTIEEFVFEGLLWSQLTLAQILLILSTYVLYILGLFLVVFSFSFVIRCELIRPKVFQILLVLAYMACLVIFIRAKFINSYNFISASSYPDSRDYIQNADLPITSLAFWAGQRSFTFPLVLKMLDVHYADGWSNQVMDRVRLFQTWLSIGCWALLALVVSLRTRQNWLKPAAFACILVFSLSFNIGKWDSYMLSESVSISLFVLLVAHWIAWPFLESKKIGEVIRWLFLVELTAVTILYSFVRDSNSYFLLVAGAIFLLGIIFKKKENILRRFHLIYVFVILLVVVSQNITITVGNRWQVFIYDHLAMRILENDSARDFFAAHGLPVSDALMDLVGMNGAQYLPILKNAPEMQPVRQWVEQSGKSTYFQYLLNNWTESLAAPINHANTLLNDNPYLDYVRALYPARPVPNEVAVITQAFNFNLPVIEWLAGITLMGISIFWLIRRRANSVWFGIAILALSIYPMMFIIWHGDPMEVPRHALQVSMQFRLAAWMALIFLVDAVTTRIFVQNDIITL